MTDEFALFALFENFKAEFFDNDAGNARKDSREDEAHQYIHHTRQLEQPLRNCLRRKDGCYRNEESYTKGERALEVAHLFGDF